MEKAGEEHKNQLKKATEEAEQQYQIKLEEALSTEREVSASAIESACEEERKKTKELLDELKVCIENSSFVISDILV